MPQVLPSRSSSLGRLTAVAVFILVYAGVLVVTFAPRDMITAQSGSFIGDTD